MQWPDRPTAHDKDYQTAMMRHVPVWSPARPDAVHPKAPIGFRSCSYCGSIHPEDLLNALASGAILEGSDWKYGWPHKFYVRNIPNPTPELQVWIGGRYYTNEAGERVEEDRWGPQGPYWDGKWYNIHFMDQGYDEEALQALMQRVSELSGIQWRFDAEKGVHYSAPYRGFQRGLI